MINSEALNQKINAEFVTVIRNLVSSFELMERLPLKQPSAVLYRKEGVQRRLYLLRHSLQTIFDIFPPERTEPLDMTSVTDVICLLHTFLINLFGCFDNLAWVVLEEKQISIARNQVGLYHKKTQLRLSKSFCDYLNGPKIRTWHDTHLKYYRDALAHRLPPYVPPVSINQLTGQATSCAVFTLCSEKGEKKMYLHDQLLADANTIIEVVGKFANFEFQTP